jgi:hypothetical protein
MRIERRYFHLSIVLHMIHRKSKCSSFTPKAWAERYLTWFVFNLILIFSYQDMIAVQKSGIFRVRLMFRLSGFSVVRMLHHHNLGKEKRTSHTSWISKLYSGADPVSGLGGNSLFNLSVGPPSCGKYILLRRNSASQRSELYFDGRLEESLDVMFIPFL